MAIIMGAVMNTIMSTIMDTAVNMARNRGIITTTRIRMNISKPINRNTAAAGTTTMTGIPMDTIIPDIITCRTTGKD